MALHRCQFLSPLTTAEAESLNLNQLLGGCFSVASDRDDFLQCGSNPSLPAGDGGSGGMSTCCNIANIYSWTKRVWFLPWLWVFPCKLHSGGLGLCLALAARWHHCVNPWQVSEAAAAKGVYICWAVFCWVLPKEKLNHRVGSRFCFSQWKNWTLSNDTNGFSFQQWERSIFTINL